MTDGEARRGGRRLAAMPPRESRREILDLPARQGRETTSGGRAGLPPSMARVCQRARPAEPGNAAKELVHVPVNAIAIDARSDPRP